MDVASELTPLMLAHKVVPAVEEVMVEGMVEAVDTEAKATVVLREVTVAVATAAVVAMAVVVLATRKAGTGVVVVAISSRATAEEEAGTKPSTAVALREFPALQCTCVGREWSAPLLIPLLLIAHHSLGSIDHFPHCLTHIDS